MRHLVRQKRSSPGQSLVEFSLVSLLLLATTFGIIDLGRVVLDRTMLTNAVREAVRRGSIVPSDCCASGTSMFLAASNRSPSLGLDPGDFTPAPVCSVWSSGSTKTCSSAIPGDRIRVCIRHTVSLTATRLIGFSSITMNECENATVQ